MSREGPAGWRERLAERSTALEQVGEERRSRLLSTILVVLSALFAVIDVILVATQPGYSPPWYGYVILGTALWVNRAGHYRLAAATTVGMVTAVTFAQLLAKTSPAHLSVGFLVIGPLLAALLLPKRAVVAVVAINVVGVAALGWLRPDAYQTSGDLISPIAVNVIAGALAVLAAAHRDRVADDRREDLARREEHLRLALAAADLGTWDWEISPAPGVPARPRAMSDRALAILGVDEHALAGGPEAYLARIPHEDRARVEREARECLSKGEVVTEHRFKRDDGTLRTLEVRGAVVERDASGGAVRVLGVLSDVTERRRAGQEIERLGADLRQAQKMDALGRLAGGVAHDFNNLLTVILANVDLAQVDGHSAELADIRHAAESAATLTQRLLTFGRKGPSHPRVVSPGEVLRETVKMLRRLVGEGVRIELSLADELGSVTLDVPEFEQALMNLATNARDAMPGGGTLTLSAGNVSFQAGEAYGGGTVPGGEFVRISVRDSGCGMAPHVLERAAEPFFTTKDPGRGTGLGLPMVFSAVRQADGFFRIESREGEGTAVHLFFPRAGVGHAESGRTSHMRPRGRERILLVEDSDDVRRLVAKNLRSAGYQVEEAASGEAGRAAVAAEPSAFDLVMTDVVMPGMGGAALVSELRQIRPSIRVLYITGYAPDPAILGEQVVTKPFDADVLLSRVRAVLATDSGATSERARDTSAAP